MSDSLRATRLQIYDPSGRAYAKLTDKEREIMKQAFNAGRKYERETVVSPPLTTRLGVLL